MHNPGICGVILAADQEAVADEKRLSEQGAGLSRLIDSLNSNTEMVLIAAPIGAQSLTAIAWAHGAYVVEITDPATEADALHLSLQDVLNRGRDAALVTTLRDKPVAPETVREIISAYGTASDNVWALAPECNGQIGQPLLLGRSMIEKYLRGFPVRGAREIFASNREHLMTLKVADSNVISDWAAKLLSQVTIF